MSEETLIILKPDCMTAGICGAVISRFEAEGFKIEAAKIGKVAFLEPDIEIVPVKSFLPLIKSFCIKEV